MKKSFKFQGQKGFRVKVEGFRFRFFRVFRGVCGKMKISAAVVSAFCLFPLALAAGWPPVLLTHATSWGEAVTPQNIQGAYPRPTLVRAEWQSLNGLWEYGITSVAETNPADGLFSSGSADATRLNGLDRFQKSCSWLRGWKSCPAHAFSLTPGFSPVPIERPDASRFNGFSSRGKPLKRLVVDGFAGTGLELGVNEMSYNIFGNALNDLNGSAGRMPGSTLNPGQILVPFPVESPLSGVRQRVTEFQRIWYRRSFKVPPAWRDRRPAPPFFSSPAGAEQKPRQNDEG